MAGEREKGLAVFIDEILVLYLAGHHDEGLDEGGDGVNVEALVVGEEDTEAEGEGHKEAEVGGEELEEVLGDGGEHLDVDTEGGEAADHQHQLPPH